MTPFADFCALVSMALISLAAGTSTPLVFYVGTLVLRVIYKEPS